MQLPSLITVVAALSAIGGVMAAPLPCPQVCYCPDEEVFEVDERLNGMRVAADK